MQAKQENRRTKAFDVANPDTPPLANSETPSAKVSWWVWLAWIERESGGGFAYGCAAQSFRSAGWSDEAGFDIPGGGRLVVRQCTVTDENFGRFRDQLTAGMIDTASLQPSKIIQAQITAIRAIVQDGLGQSGVRTALHYTVPDVEVLIDLAHGSQRLFAKQEAHEQRGLLNFVLSNSTWKNGELTVTLRQPFDLIAEATALAAKAEDGGALNAPEHPVWLGD
jgi:hypothetical protein